MAMDCDTGNGGKEGSRPSYSVVGAVTVLHIKKKGCSVRKSSLRPCCLCVPHARTYPQAFERQVDSLSRQLSQGEADAEELVRHREALLEELRAAQQVEGVCVWGGASGACSVRAGQAGGGRWPGLVWVAGQVRANRPCPFPASLLLTFPSAMPHPHPSPALP